MSHDSELVGHIYRFNKAVLYFFMGHVEHSYCCDTILSVYMIENKYEIFIIYPFLPFFTQIWLFTHFTYSKMADGNDKPFTLE